MFMGYKRVDGTILEAKQSVGRRDIPLMSRDREKMSFCQQSTSRIPFRDVLWGFVRLNLVTNYLTEH